MKIYEKCTDCDEGTRHFDNQDSIAVAVKCSYCEEGKLEVEPDVLAKEFAEWLDENLWTRQNGEWYCFADLRTKPESKSTDDLFTQFLTEKGYEKEN